MSTLTPSLAPSFPIRVLMTGGSGLLGQAFMRRFPYYKYTVVSRHAHFYKNHANKQAVPDIKWVRCLSYFKHLNDFDIVVNLAGEPIVGKRWNKQHKHELCHSRWDITKALVELVNISDNPPASFFSASAIGVYGHQGDTLLTETSTCTRPDFTSHLCQQWEAIAQTMKPSVRLVLLRTGIVLTTQGGALAKLLPSIKLGLGGRLGSGKQYMSWIHLDDYLDGLNFAINNVFVEGAVNLVAPNPVTNKDFTKTLASTLSRPSFLSMPALALKLMLGQAACLLLDSQRVSPEKLMFHEFKFSHPHLQPALEHLLNRS